MIELTDKVIKRFETQLKKIFVGNTTIREDKPEFNQVHYSKYGHLEITNSHVAVRLSNVHDKYDSDEKYPDLNKQFEIPDRAVQVEFSKEDIKLLEDQLEVLYKNKVEALSVTLNQEGIFVKSNKQEDVFHESGIYKTLDVQEEFTFGINSRYFHDALMMFRLMKLEDINLYVEPNKRSLIHIVSKNLHYIIMPFVLTV